MEEYVANNITELTVIVEEVTKKFEGHLPWWRGQTNESWHLIPSLYRQKFEDIESSINMRFMMNAGSRYEKCPGEKEYFNWLYLMQHYRLPTRILDWTESPLIGLFFAIEEESFDEKDASLWALNPSVLNLEFCKKKTLFTPHSETIKKMSKQAFKVEPKDKISNILAVVPAQKDLRHMMQQSVITLHGGKKKIDELPKKEKFLTHILIPASRKIGFRYDLSQYGISRANLFPDLENLAKQLISKEFGISN